MRIKRFTDVAEVSAKAGFVWRSARRDDRTDRRMSSIVDDIDNHVGNEHTVLFVIVWDKSFTRPYREGDIQDQSVNQSMQTQCLIMYSAREALDAEVLWII